MCDSDDDLEITAALEILNQNITNKKLNRVQKRAFSKQFYKFKKRLDYNKKKQQIQDEIDNNENEDDEDTDEEEYNNSKYAKFKCDEYIDFLKKSRKERRYVNENTGLSYDIFIFIYFNLLSEKMKQTFTHKDYTSFPVILLIVLKYLKTATSFEDLGKIFGIKKSRIYHMIMTMLPIMFLEFNFIFFVCRENRKTWRDYGGCIDCTSAERDRIHPGQAFYYRPDKKMHFLSIQVVAGFDNYIYHVVVSKGHNNDKAIYLDNKMDLLLYNNDIKLLADQGYGENYSQLKVCHSPEYCSKRVKIENIDFFPFIQICTFTL